MNLTCDRDQFYQACPATGVEHFLRQARTLDPNRTPEEPDALDLQHGVLGLSYCDSFVTEDRYAYSNAGHTIKSLTPLPLATLHKKLEAGAMTTTRLSPSGDG